MNGEWIVIRGAREHNLRNITVRLPRNALTVITGVSGSGKSSLAFDTLFAEGQRRYVESLSAYARQFLDQMPKPDVDAVEGLSPAIAIEQRTAGSNPRSLVATATEIHDYLRLLFVHIGRPHCPSCGREVAAQSAAEIVERILAGPAGARVLIVAPLAIPAKGRLEAVFEAVRKRGFTRLRVDGTVYEADQPPPVETAKGHRVEVVVDRLVLKPDVRSRLTDSVELALREGGGFVTVAVEAPGAGDGTETTHSEHCACLACGIHFERLRPQHFSFNSPHGACPGCGGLGSRLEFDEELVVPNPALSLDAGAVKAWRRGGRRLILYYKGLLRALAKHYGFSLETPWKDLPARIRQILLMGSGPVEIEFGYWRGGVYRRHRRPFEGILPNLERRYRETESELTRQGLRRFMTRKPCAACRGDRLRPESLACTIQGRSIADVTRQSVAEALAFVRSLTFTEREEAMAGSLRREIEQRLLFLAGVGLDYLTLDRESGTLSGGESQRIRLATQIGARLVGVLYVLDEPSIGLHHRDNARLLRTLQQLRDAGNTVVVVEHDEAAIRAADYVVDLGPGAGREGGEVVFQGPPPDLAGHPVSLTARYLDGRSTIAVPRARKPVGQEWLRIEGASEHNLKDENVAVPLGLFVCVTGVSGSGKSTLVDVILRRELFRRLHGSTEPPGRHRRLTGWEALDAAVVIDQSPIGRTPRSNPATYTGAFGVIRELFASLPAAKVKGYGPGRFSFNVKGGRCERCKGDGVLRLEMHFLPDVYVTCEQCRGHRYNPETLEVRYAGRNIAETLTMTVDEALEFFRNVPALARKLGVLSKVGLGYVQLGQPATTLSGGEAQRMKLATELARPAGRRTIYLLDEPTTGLHFADVERLLLVLEELREAGHTVLVVEHNLDVIKRADYIIDLGPEGGVGGGRVVACGTPEKVAASPASHTGAALRSVLGC